mmetsp:Transcript_28495/g.42330  ORF Transcript_28495/g.42330 Transcript_28495/m.42330 type:complete len:103 (+) Transcript_28495:28-336(+)
MEMHNPSFKNARFLIAGGGKAQAEFVANNDINLWTVWKEMFNDLTTCGPCARYTPVPDPEDFEVVEIVEGDDHDDIGFELIPYSEEEAEETIRALGGKNKQD